MHNKARQIFAPISALLCITLFSACGENEKSQGVNTIQDNNSPEYRISLEKVAVLGVGHEGTYLTSQSLITVDSKGHYYIGPTTEQGMINVYNTTGDLIRTIGRYGAGPGEINDISRLAMSDEDTLYVYDYMLHRFNVYARDGQFIRSFHFPVIPQFMATIENGQIAISAWIFTNERTGFQYHVLDLQGRNIRNFCKVEAATRGDFFSELKPIAGSNSANSLIWSSEFRKYEICLWDLRGRRSRIYQRSVPWFREWTDRTPEQPYNNPPQPIMKDITDIGSDRLLVLISLADVDWKPVDIQRDASGHRQSIPASTRDLLHDSILEIIDTKNGRILASERFDYMISGILDSTRIWIGQRRWVSA